MTTTDQQRAVTEWREQSLARLDDMHRRAWPAALTGDLTAMRAVLRIAELRCAVLGLYHDEPLQETPS